MSLQQLVLDPSTASDAYRSAFVDHELVVAPSEPKHHIIRATVCNVSAPAQHLRRIVIESPELVGFKLSGPDEFFGLFMPQVASGKLHLPVHAGGANIRASVAAMPDELRPHLRWYTVRSLNPVAGQLTFDVVTHGVTTPSYKNIGPGLRWVLSAQTGDQVAIWTCQGLWHRGRRSQTLIADPSAAPSVRAILEYTHAFAPDQLKDMHVRMIAESPNDLEPLLNPNWEDELGSLDILFAPSEKFSETTIAHLRGLDHSQHPATQSKYVWVAGEGQLCKEVRHHAIHTWGLDSESVQWCPYWFLGRARP